MTDDPSPPRPRPRVGVVVLTWRDRVQTLRCVQRLLADEGIARIVVVDNEADGTIAQHFEPDPRLSFEELTSNTGFAVGVNTGLRILAGDPLIDLFLAINNDATIESEDLDRLVDVLSADDTISMVGPRIVTPEGQQFSAGGVVNRLTWTIRQPKAGETPDFLTWACVLMRRETLETVGFLDERFFMYWEDVDFGLRMSRQGLRFREVPDARLVHEVSSSHVRAGSRILAYSSQAFRHFLRVHGGMTTASGIARLALKAGVAAASGDRRGAKYVVAGWRIGRRSPDPAYPALERLP